jgi:tRNA threonylcarbamoyladenosine biosynthesis protein TsaB
LDSTPAIRTLALDTSSVKGSVCLLEGREVVAEFRLCSLETHSARLLRSLDFLLEAAGWDLSGLGLIVAGLGPGSFTGIRIGIATALGLAQTLGIPFAGASGLDALAHRAGLPDGRLDVVADARRSQVYHAEYLRRNGRVRRMSRPALFHPQDLQAHLRSGRTSVIGEGAQLYAKELGLTRTGWPRLIEAELFLSADLGRLALARKRSWRRGDELRAEPLYIRPPDARRARRMQA